MGETTDQIESHILTQRADLQSNLNELGRKVRSAIDWRQYFQNHTGTMLALAFCGGILLSSMLRHRAR
jgi:hypothetical protein